MLQLIISESKTGGEDNHKFESRLGYIVNFISVCAHCGSCFKNENKQNKNYGFYFLTCVTLYAIIFMLNKVLF